ncbi:MAG: DNA polymerase I, partial [Ruminococcus sp.]|nr:DNA polymerase I [Ruminococcus sp.]
LADLKLTPSVRAKLEGGHRDALDSRFLAEIFLEVPIDTDIESYAVTGGDREKTRELLAGLEMFKLMERLDVQGSVSGAGEVEAEKKVRLADLPKVTEKALESADIKAFEQSGKVGCELKGGTLKVIGGDVVYVTSDKALMLEFLRCGCEKYAFEGKSLHLLAFGGGARVQNLVFCCDLAGYLLNSQSSDYTAENLCLAYKVAYRSDCGENADIASLLPLCENLQRQLEQTEMTELYRDIELPLCEVLASMEFYGVKADVDGIKSFGEGLKGKIAELTQQIYEYAGEEFNIASTKQLGAILFEKLKLPAKKKTKSGYSTGAEVLEELENRHPIIPLILEYRTLTKLDSTYVEGLLKQIGTDGRVHSVFKQTETRTGRISSTEPNMQNIPVRKEIGRNMRKFFVAKDGYVLVDADYSQIELRVLSCVCGDENMQEAFLSGKDIHRSTAAQVFDLPEDFVSDEMRRAAKAVNFGIIYGIGAFSLSKDIGVSVAEAKQYIANYLANYPKVSQFMDRTVEDGARNGYVTTIFGRRRYIPELNASNKMVQAFGKRAAMNAPIQGAAADIIKLAMVKVYKRIEEEKLDAKLILQVHDELILEVAEKDREKAEKLLKEEMEGAVRLAVPFTADVHSGHSWYDAKG